jgi:hypothetical protein
MATIGYPFHSADRQPVVRPAVGFDAARVRFIFQIFFSACCRAGVRAARGQCLELARRVHADFVFISTSVYILTGD